MGTVTVVFDTNVLVSALGFGGTPLRAVLRAFDDDVQLVVSEATLTELERVMTYEHLPFSPADRHQYLSILRTEGELITPEIELDVIDDDPDDNRFLECAVEADADYLVSGDKQHVQPIEEYRGIQIVSPREFLRLSDKNV